MPGKTQLICWIGYDETTRHHDQKVLRNLTDAEVEDVVAASRFLREFLIKGTYNDLHEAHDDLLAAIEALEAEWKSSRSLPETSLREIQKALKAWLSALRSFDDSTSHRLSSRYGKGSDEFASFKAYLSHIYDLSFGYRLATQLRNVATHADDVLNAVGLEATEADDGEVHHLVRLGIHGPRLAEQFPKIKSSVRRDLHGLAREISLRDLVEEVLVMCSLAYSRLLLRLASDIDAAASSLEALHKEATDAGGQAAAIWRHKERSPGEHRMVVNVQWIEVQHAWSARTTLDAAREVVASASHT